ncbi:hypothetical protein PoB_001238000 [Plakobranchus ocellatus]|uniref:Uncharacterized protein n=1 Tax=Plakobranchus ocellatus TaxID=259542 RepID=A0AAV3YSV4_9GAST|nr:hypothetical protein PoB_001238000 [Plakobranchus ocellatus]
MCVDGDHCGQVVGYSLCPRKAHLEVFGKHDEGKSSDITTVMINKDLSGIRSLKQAIHRNIRLGTKINTMIAYIWSILLCGCGCWTLTKYLERRLEVTGNHNGGHGPAKVPEKSALGFIPSSVGKPLFN